MQNQACVAKIVHIFAAAYSCYSFFLFCLSVTSLNPTVCQCEAVVWVLSVECRGVIQHPFLPSRLHVPANISERSLGIGKSASLRKGVFVYLWNFSLASCYFEKSRGSKNVVRTWWFHKFMQIHDVKTSIAQRGTHAEGSLVVGGDLVVVFHYCGRFGQKDAAVAHSSSLWRRNTSAVPPTFHIITLFSFNADVSSRAASGFQSSLPGLFSSQLFNYPVRICCLAALYFAFQLHLE